MGQEKEGTSKNFWVHCFEITTLPPTAAADVVQEGLSFPKQKEGSCFIATICITSLIEKKTAFKCSPQPQAKSMHAHVSGWYLGAIFRTKDATVTSERRLHGHWAAQPARPSPAAPSLTTSCSHLLRDKGLAQQISRKPSLTTGLHRIFRK